MTSKTKQVIDAVESGKRVRFNRWKSMSLSSRIAICVLGVIVFISLIAPWIAPYSPDFVDTEAMRQVPTMPVEIFSRGC